MKRNKIIIAILLMIAIGTCSKLMAQGCYTECLELLVFTDRSVGLSDGVRAEVVVETISGDTTIVSEELFNETIRVGCWLNQDSANIKEVYIEDIESLERIYNYRKIKRYHYPDTVYIHDTEVIPVIETETIYKTDTIIIDQCKPFENIISTTDGRVIGKNLNLEQAKALGIKEPGQYFLIIYNEY